MLSSPTHVYDNSLGGTTGSVQSVEVVPVSGVQTVPLGMVSSTLPSYLGRLQPTLPTWRFLCVLSVFLGEILHFLTCLYPNKRVLGVSYLRRYNVVASDGIQPVAGGTGRRAAARRFGLQQAELNTGRTSPSWIR